MDLSIIIVNYNTSKLLQNCLRSVYKSLDFAHLQKKAEVIVVDNASTDDSVLMIKREYPNVIIMTNKKNLGFAKANNQGIKRSCGRYILLLNSDTELIENALFLVMNLIKKDKRVDIVGCKLLNLDGSTQLSIGFFPTLWRVFFWMFFIDDLPGIKNIVKSYHMENKEFYDNSQEVDWVTGAFMLIKRKAIKKAGLLDEKIFMYGEEVEWCYRLKQKGSNIYYFPIKAAYHHKGGSGEGKDSGIIGEFAAISYFYNKHRPKWQSYLVRQILLFGALLRFLLFGIIMRSSQKASLYAKAFKLVR